jgi:hypothetical protein
MNFPQLPTDNLYKFMALVGVIVLLSSFVFPSYHMFEIERQQVIARAEFEVLKAKNDLLNSESAELDLEREHLKLDMERAKKGKASQESSKEIESRSQNLRDRYAEIRAKRHDILANSALIGGKLEEIERLLKWMGHYIVAMAVGGLVGVLLISSGFRLWYDRVQVYQDALLRKQVNENSAKSEERKWRKPR